jgi:hypothetical protein
MKIQEHYYNEDNGRLYVEFSTKKDGDKFYRILELDYEEIEFYSPTIIYEEDLLGEIDESLIIDIIFEYLKDNDLPDEIVL